jgi:hypothetical protein
MFGAAEVLREATEPSSAIQQFFLINPQMFLRSSERLFFFFCNSFFFLMVFREGRSYLVHWWPPSKIFQRWAAALPQSYSRDLALQLRTEFAPVLAHPLFFICW